MFYSYSLEDNKFDFFILFLTHIVKGDTRYTDLVIPILKDAHEFATGNKNVYTINRSNFPIVVHLVEAEKDYFKFLNTDSLTKPQYQHILNLASKQRDVAVV